MALLSDYNQFKRMAHFFGVIDEAQRVPKPQKVVRIGLLGASQVGNWQLLEWVRGVCTRPLRGRPVPVTGYPCALSALHCKILCTRLVFSQIFRNVGNVVRNYVIHFTQL